MTKFSVSYNVFDGVELLEDSINHIRSVVDHISIVFQTRSYWGNELTSKEIEIVQDLYDRKLVDDLYMFENDNTIAIHQNQLNKRNLGIELAKQAGCTHFMTVDCDEFYVTSEFQMLVDYHRENPEHVSYLPLIAYYKDTKYMINPVNYMDGDLYVSGFFPVKYNLIMNFPLNIKVDPTRKVGLQDLSLLKLFRKFEIKMHHLSYVRADIFQKVNNAPSKLRYGDKPEFFKQIVDCYNNFEINRVAISADNKQYEIIEVEPVITINNYYNLIGSEDEK